MSSSVVFPLSLVCIFPLLILCHFAHLPFALSSSIFFGIVLLNNVVFEIWNAILWKQKGVSSSPPAVVHSHGERSPDRLVTSRTGCSGITAVAFWGLQQIAKDSNQ
jgi:hypothetical protein